MIKTDILSLSLSLFLLSLSLTCAALCAALCSFFDLLTCYLGCHPQRHLSQRLGTNRAVQLQCGAWKQYGALSSSKRRRESGSKREFGVISKMREKLLEESFPMFQKSCLAFQFRHQIRQGAHSDTVQPAQNFGLPLPLPT